jgi:hypothetical protein
MSIIQSNDTPSIQHNPAPTDLDEALSPEWLSLALSTIEPVEVTAVTVVQTQKTMATKVRFTVEFKDAQAPLGTAYCVKGFFGENPLTDIPAKNSQAEVRYYQQISPQSDVNTPIARYAEIDETSGHGILLMEDVVAAGGRFLSAAAPYSPDQAERSLAQLATLHAESWNDVGPDRYGWLRNRLDDMVERSYLPLDELQDLLDGERGIPLDASILDAQRVYRGIGAVAARAADLPQCLVHGDAHAGNLFEQDGELALIDWQLLQRNSWALDVSYHVGAALSVDDRRSSETDLLRGYLERLSAHGVEAPSWDAAWNSYREHMAYGYYLWAITRFVEPTITHEFVKRLGTAVTDLETYRLLDV